MNLDMFAATRWVPKGLLAAGLVWTMGWAGLPAQATPEADWLRCAPMADATARLACYDAVAAAARRSGATPAAAAPPSMATQVARFGAPEPSAKEQLDAIESQVMGLVDGWSAGQVFQLTNGQRWVVSDGSSAVMYLKDPKVVVRRAAMGTFRIEFEGSNHTARVKRMP